MGPWIRVFLVVRLYGWKEEGRRAGRVCRRTGVVVARKEEEAVAQGDG
jgi:hypothetical protein